METESPSTPSVAGEARLERDGETSRWFPWAWVSADDIEYLAVQARLRLATWHVADGRWFARLRH